MFEYKIKYEDVSVGGQIYPEVSMTLHEEATLTDQLHTFEQFLKAAGYHFEGTLQILPDDEFNYGENEDSWEEDYLADKIEELDEPVVE